MVKRAEESFPCSSALCSYLATLENAQSQLAITLELKPRKDSLGCDTSKSDHRTAARKQRASKCRERSHSSSVGAGLHQHTPYMATLFIYFCEGRDRSRLGNLLNTF